MKYKAVLATTPSDAHSWNLIYMEMVLSERGYEVFNLGPCTPIETIVNTCIEINPEIVVITTVNGHGFIELKKIVTGIRELIPAERMQIYLGGKLSTDSQLTYLYELELINSGYAGIYCGSDAVNDFCFALEKNKRSETTNTA